MAGRRSLPGRGRVSLIYTVGAEDLHAGGLAPKRSSDDPVLNAMVGEDFADCGWPVTVKVQADVIQRDLTNYLERLASTVRQGFYMQAGAGPALYWRWTGSVPPGMSVAEGRSGAYTDNDQTVGTGRRSAAGRGLQCAIYLMDDAERWNRADFYGRKCGRTAVSASVDEDYSSTKWPVVVKAHPEVTRAKLLQYLTDLTQCVRSGFFLEVTPVLL